MLVCHATSPICVVMVESVSCHENQRKISANYYHMAGIYCYDRARFVSDVAVGISMVFMVTRLP